MCTKWVLKVMEVNIFPYSILDSMTMLWANILYDLILFMMETIQILIEENKLLRNKRKKEPHYYQCPQCQNNTVTSVVWQLDVLELSVHYSCGFEVWGRLADLSISSRHDGGGGKWLRARHHIHQKITGKLQTCSLVEPGTPPGALIAVKPSGNLGQRTNMTVRLKKPKFLRLEQTPRFCSSLRRVQKLAKSHASHVQPAGNNSLLGSLHNHDKANWRGDTYLMDVVLFEWHSCNYQSWLHFLQFYPAIIQTCH